MGQVLCPKCHLYILNPGVDPFDHRVHHAKGEQVTYLTHDDFGDFNELDWASMSKKFKIDMERTLVIVNDHPSGLQRTIDARDWGFRHIFHPTNYAPGTGDHYSLKKTCSMSENVYFDGVTMEKAILTYEGRRSLLKQKCTLPRCTTSSRRSGRPATVST